MLKKIVALCLIATSFQHVSAVENAHLSGRAGYQFLTDDTLAKIYKNGGPQLAVAYSYKTGKNLSLSANAGFFEATGKSIGLNEKTKLSKSFLDLGVIWHAAQYKKLSLDLTVGPRISIVSQRNETPIIAPLINAQGLGAFGNVHAYAAYKDIYVGVFAEFSYEPIRHNKILSDGYTPPTCSVGGIALGLSLMSTF